MKKLMLQLIPLTPSGFARRHLSCHNVDLQSSSELLSFELQSCNPKHRRAFDKDSGECTLTL